MVFGDLAAGGGPGSRHRGDTSHANSPSPAGARVFMRLSACVFQVYNSNKDNQSEGSEYFFSSLTPERWLSCGRGQQEMLVTLGCAGLPGAGGVTGLSVGTPGWPQGELSVAPSRDQGQKPAGGTWGCGEQCQAVPCTPQGVSPPVPVALQRSGGLGTCS